MFVFFFSRLISNKLDAVIFEIVGSLLQVALHVGFHSKERLDNAVLAGLIASNDLEVVLGSHEIDDFFMHHIADFAMLGSSPVDLFLDLHRPRILKFPSLLKEPLCHSEVCTIHIYVIVILALRCRSLLSCGQEVLEQGLIEIGVIVNLNRLSVV